MKFGKKIAIARNNAGLTQSELAAKTGISRPTIQLYEYDKVDPSMSKLQKIAAVLGIPIDFFLTDSDQGSSRIIKDHQGSFNGNIKDHQGSFNGNIKDHQGSSANIGEHRRTSDNIRQHSSGSANIIGEHQTTSDNISLTDRSTSPAIDLHDRSTPTAIGTHLGGDQHTLSTHIPPTDQVKIYYYNSVNNYILDRGYDRFCIDKMAAVLLFNTHDQEVAVVKMADEMEPVIARGELAVVERVRGRSRDIKDQYIYIIDFYGEIIVRYVEWVNHEKVRIYIDGDNAIEFPSKDMDGGVKALGRIVSTIRECKVLPFRKLKM
ncbi:hypothetical protein FACS189487_05580 [Campylobacterota bacterium]|nr:hypothetical protein FACS189487_05580 [Campylobacterota bacterium]